jgi:ligand-binding sensor domain-containing protein/signal transduction histidine kinase
MKQSTLYLILLLAMIAPNTYGQRQHIRFSRLGTDQGLSHSNGTCILQDSRGFIWIGTRDGLNRYDGYRFTIFRSKAGDAGSLSNSFISAMAEDRQGALWIGTWGGGLDKFDREKRNFIHYDLAAGHGADVSPGFINALLVDSRGRLWVGTDGGGIRIVDVSTGHTGQITAGKGPRELSDNDVTAIYEDADHVIWVGTFKGGLNRIDPVTRRVERYQHQDGDPLSLGENSVSRVVEDSRKRLWVGTRGGGLDRMDRVTGRFTHFRHDPHDPNSLGHDVVSAIAEDDLGGLWIGTENGGFTVMDAATGDMHTYTQDELDNTSLSNNSVDCIYRDRRGNMWLGTYSGGVDVFKKDANKFITFRHNGSPESLANNNVLYLLEDQAKTIWVGTDGGGLGEMDPASGRIRTFLHSPSNANTMGGNYVLSVHEDQDRKLWIGTWGDGLTVLDAARRKFTRLRNIPGDSTTLGGNNIYSITRDTAGDLWLGAYGSCLDRYDRKTNRFSHYRPDPGNPNSLASTRIHTLLADRQGLLWIGTFDGGLDRFDKKTGRFTHYIHSDSANSLSNNSVNCIYQDHNDDLWIGTSNGLNVLHPKTGRFTGWSTADGLPNNMIYAVVEDARQNLWISTNHGLSRFNRRTGRFENFSSADGLQSNEFKPHSCLVSSTGLLYFGGVGGFNEFCPDSITHSPFEPPLRITNFEIFNKEVPVASDSVQSPLTKDIGETSDLTLSYRNSVISFEFASLDYTTEESHQYAYTLEGFDTGWNYIGSRRMATYTNIDPGRYTFKVKGLNPNGSWTSPTNLAILITPPFWRTWWFRLMACLALIAAILVIHFIRLKTLQNQKRKLEDQVAKLLDRAVAQGKYETASDVLHDIGNSLISFSTYLGRIKRTVDNDKSESLLSLAAFFLEQRAALSAALGETKAIAVTDMLHGIGEMESNNRKEMRSSIADQERSIHRIQEILHIQRQYISGHAGQERSRVDLRKIISDAGAMLSASMIRHGISLKIEAPETPVLFKGDRTQLMEAILALLKNSIEALQDAHSGQTITIRLMPADGHIGLTISDPGRGFDQETAVKLFTRGFSTTLHGGGTGLYNCRRIVESHGGSISLNSDGPGKGCRATMRFLTTPL